MLPSEIQDIKSGLIDWINNLSDTDMLSFLDGIRQSHSDVDWWDELSEAQKERINKGLEEAKNGNTISSEGFWKRLKTT